LLEPRRLQDPPRAAHDDELPPVLQPHAAAETSRVPLFDLSFGSELSRATDGSTWLGLNAGGCVHFDPLCIGARVRGAYDANISGASEDTDTQRLALDMLLTLDLSMRVGDTNIAPGVGFGAGWVHTTNDSENALPAAGNIGFDGGGMRGDAHVALGWKVAGLWSMNVSLAVDLSMSAHSDDFREGAATLVGEPVGFARAAVGLTYGAR
jgi:hypothetical protein